MREAGPDPVLGPPSAALRRGGGAGWLFRRVPALDALRDYSWGAFGRDLTAGLTVATVAVPQAMAYASLAGLPPQYGLYTAIVMTAVGALLDSSRLLVNGPTNAISIALLSALAVVPDGDRVNAAVTLAFLVGAVQLGIALLRLGDLTRYVSHSVVLGFMVGAALLLVLDQTKHLLGLDPRGEPTDHLLKRFWLTLTDGGGAHGPTVLVAAGTVAVVLAIRQVNAALRARGARFPIPQHLVAVAVMAALVGWLRLDSDYGVKVVGAVPAELPAFRVPGLKWDQVRLLAGNAFAIAVLGLLEALAMAKAIAAAGGQKLDPNQQCLSEGAANLAGSFFQCFPGSGSLTRSAVNQQAGAVSQWSGVFAAAAVAGTVVFLAPLAQYVPRASLAGLLVLAAYRMVDGRQLLFHLRATRLDAGVVIATALGAILISVEFCVVIGVFLSFVLYVPRAAQVRLTPLPPAPDGQTVAFELEGELFFGAQIELADHLAAVERAARGGVRTVALVLSRGRNPDAAFLSLLRGLYDTLRARGVALHLDGVQSDLTAALRACGLQAILGTRPADPAGQRGP
jgi:SulP family sulfate permease